MKEMSLEKCAALHTRFVAADFRGRLALFNEHFKLNPFRFPPFDPNVSWFTDKQRLQQLSDIYDRERVLGQSVFQRDYHFGEQTFSFNVQPGPVWERDAFHDLVLREFLQEKEGIREAFEQRLAASPGRLRTILLELSPITRALQWIPAALNTRMRTLPPLLLRVFFSGLVSDSEGLNGKVKIRRKFIELYLHAQGLLVRDYHNWLEKRLMDLQDQKDPVVLSLPQKIALLQQTGILNFLQGGDRKERSPRITAIISLLTADGNLDFEGVRHLAGLAGTGRGSDPVTENNLLFIAQQLSRFPHLD